MTTPETNTVIAQVIQRTVAFMADSDDAPTAHLGAYLQSVCLTFPINNSIALGAMTEIARHVSDNDKELLFKTVQPKTLNVSNYYVCLLGCSFLGCGSPKPTMQEAVRYAADRANKHLQIESKAIIGLLAYEGQELAEVPA